MTPEEKRAAAETEAIRKECLRKLSLADAEKQQFQEDFTEAYIFKMPHRIRPNNSTTTKSNDAKDLFTSLGPQLTADFASDFADTFMPEHARWAEGEPSVTLGMKVDQASLDQLAELMEAYDNIIFDAIGNSNFYTAVKQAAKDLSISAAGLSIQDYGAGQPFHCQAIPLTELWMLRGARGGVDTRYWKRMLTLEGLEETFPGIPIPPKIKAKAKDKSVKIRALQGCYRDYSVNAEVAWRVVTMFDEDLVQRVRVVGEGSAPMLVMRWDPDPTFAWGIGPGINALPDYRSIDETEYLKMKGLARRVDPPFSYTDDNVINLDGGLPNGVGIPILKGSEIQVIESKAGIEEAMYSTADMEHRIRRHYFLDEPRQEGKTPPTAYQWQDESLRRQRRLGTPAAPIWPEFIQEVYQRFRFLLVKRGELPQMLKVGSADFALKPINPLKRAALQEDALAGERFLGTLKMNYGENAPMLMTDVGETVHTMHAQHGAKGVKLKSKSEINQVADMLKQAMVAQVAAEVVGAAGPAAAGAPPA